MILSTSQHIGYFLTGLLTVFNACLKSMFDFYIVFKTEDQSFASKYNSGKNGILTIIPVHLKKQNLVNMILIIQRIFDF